MATLKGHSGPVAALAWSVDARLVVTGSEDSTARLFDVIASKCVASLCGHTNWVVGVAVSRDGRWIATASMDKTARIYSAGGLSGV